jgi:hypothetical protein
MIMTSIIFILVGSVASYHGITRLIEEQKRLQRLIEIARQEQLRLLRLQRPTGAAVGEISTIAELQLEPWHRLARATLTYETLVRRWLPFQQRLRVSRVDGDKAQACWQVALHDGQHVWETWRLSYALTAAEALYQAADRLVDYAGLHESGGTPLPWEPKPLAERRATDVDALGADLAVL